MKKILFIIIIVSLGCFMPMAASFSQDQYDFPEEPSSEELILKAWDFLGQKDYDAARAYANKCIQLYEEEASRQQASLTSFAPIGAERRYQILNDVGTAYFIIAESYKREGQFDESIKNYQKVVDDFGYALCWSPRGWFWKVAEDSAASIVNINARRTKTPVSPKRVTRRRGCAPEKPVYTFKLYDPGTEVIVDYPAYGTFKGEGTKDYKYRITDRKGLSKAAGEGIYPNTAGAYDDPDFEKYSKEGKLEGSQWNFLYKDDLKLCFLKWATVGEEPGVKQYYIANILERAGLLEHAIKAYYAVLVHFPKSVGWTYYKTPWYVGKAARDSILYITENNPDLGMKLVDAKVTVENGFDNSIRDDIFTVNPGKIIKADPGDIKPKRIDPSKLGVKRTLGKGKVQLIQFKNDDWQMKVDGKPYIIKGITYMPTPIGQSPDEGTLADWMKEDTNENGIIDAPYEAWVDKNRNNRQDSNEKPVGDFQLMKDLGVNTIRIYHQPFKLDKSILRDLYENYGIMSIIGDYFGMYAIGSGAKWHPGTDYADPEQRKNMIESIKNMVQEHKDEPYCLMWLLGNENNYGVANNANKIPDTYYAFANEAAEVIKSMDPDHPVAICNGDLLFLDSFAKNSPDVDIFSCNSYRGMHGFGLSFWESIKEVTGKPAFITEYGAPAFLLDKTEEEAEKVQEEYLKAGWKDVENNMAGSGAGNAIGAVVFEWLDEWWKAYEPYTHDIKQSWAGPFPEGWMYEEWLGIAGQGDGMNTPFLRRLREAYFVLQKLWTK